MNMQPGFERYQERLQAWMPRVRIGPPTKGMPPADGVIEWKGPLGPVRYVVEEKRHLRHQDAAIIAEQLRHWRAVFARHADPARMLLLAPHIRPQQGSVLQRAEIDYVDLAGNAHLNAPGLFVHVEGKQPEKEKIVRPRRPNRAWTKTVMALLLRPELAQAPYRRIADEAAVALGTVAECILDLEHRGFLEGRGIGRHILDRPQLVALWVQTYIDVLRPKLREARYQTKTTDKAELWRHLGDALKRREIPWALTGADAGELRTRFFRAPETEIYVPWGALDDRMLQKEIVAQPAPRVGNLIVIEPPGPALLKNQERGIPVAPNLLIYAELRYRDTQQALEAAEMLLPDVIGTDVR